MSKEINYWIAENNKQIIYLFYCSLEAWSDNQTREVGLSPVENRALISTV